jgi:hypothetical protein
MSLLTVVRDVCAVVGVLAPASVIAQINANRTMFEMLALANEMAQRIAYDNRDWTEMRKAHTFLGALVPDVYDPLLMVPQEVYPLPADYKRMLLTTNLWRSTSTQQPMQFMSDHDDWLRRRNAIETDEWGEWTTFGREIHVHPGMGPGTNARFMYLDRNCIALASGGVGDRFIADEDSFRLDERILKLGMIWQWKANKGSPYAEDLGTYQDAILQSMGREKPAPILIHRRGGNRVDAAFNR